MPIQLLKPSLATLPGYRDALERGWSPDNVRLDEARREELASIASDPQKFVTMLDDTEAKGEPIKMPDGSTAKRLPGYRRWVWDGEFCGSIGFRWQPGTAELPPHCLGHIGYSVVPWKQRRGYATEALRLILKDAAERGLPYVTLTANPDNPPSQKVILANGGKLVAPFQKPDAYGGGESLLYRIDLPPLT
jgi:predicted acetyltransferase